MRGIHVHTAPAAGRRRVVGHPRPTKYMLSGAVRVFVALACLRAAAAYSAAQAFLARCGMKQPELHGELRTVLPHQRLVFMDVGANDGNDSLRLCRLCSTYLQARGRTGASAPSLQLIQFEPNPLLGGSLASVQRQVELLEPSWNVTLVRSAVWTVANEVRKFFLPDDRSVSSSLQRGTNGAAAAEGGKGAREMMVTTIDLASFIHENVGTADVIFMKLDIECAEWFVVPHLIASRALCPIQFIRAEWHFRTHCQGLNASALLGFTERYLSQACGDTTPASHSPNSSRFIDFEADSKTRLLAFHRARMREKAV